MNFSGSYSSTNLFKNFALQNDLPLQARAIRIINVFRFALSLIFVTLYAFADKLNLSGSSNTSLFLSLALAYLFFGITLLVVTPLRSSAAIRFQPVQIVTDILFIIMMMYAAGGTQSGLGLLLIVTIVTASLVSDGRLALFYAAVATIGLLLEQSYRIAEWDLPVSTYTQSVMLSLGCFATAWLAYSLAKRVLQSEALASSRGVDLKNLAQVNELITQQIQDGVLVVDEHLNIRHYNLQAALMLSLKTNNTHDLPLKGNAPAIENALREWFKSNDVDKNIIIQVDSHALNLRLQPLNHQNRKLGAVIFIQDWSKIQAAAQQAKLAALGRLTVSIAHEIRNPLSAISHANQLLQEEHHSEANARILEIIEDNTLRIDQIIKDVLELNRRDRIHQEKILLDQFIVDFHTQFCAIEKIPTSHFTLALYPEQHSIIFDRNHLTQILWNLCKNAWQHGCKEIGSLRLDCAHSPNTEQNAQANLLLKVIDDGAGIAEQDRSRLFEPFYTTKTTGNGLGLYISRELSEANNARLYFQPLAHGSAFILELKHTQ